MTIQKKDHRCLHHPDQLLYEVQKVDENARTHLICLHSECGATYYEDENGTLQEVSVSEKRNFLIPRTGIMEEVRSDLLVIPPVRDSEGRYVRGDAVFYMEAALLEMGFVRSPVPEKKKYHILALIISPGGNKYTPLFRKVQVEKASGFIPTVPFDEIYLHMLRDPALIEKGVSEFSKERGRFLFRFPKIVSWNEFLVEFNKFSIPGQLPLSLPRTKRGFIMDVVEEKCYPYWASLEGCVGELVKSSVTARRLYNKVCRRVKEPEKRSAAPAPSKVKTAKRERGSCLAPVPDNRIFSIPSELCTANKYIKCDKAVTSGISKCVVICTLPSEEKCNERVSVQLTAHKR